MVSPVWNKAFPPLVPVILLHIVRRCVKDYMSSYLFFGSSIFSYKFVSVALSCGVDNVTVRLSPPAPIPTDGAWPTSASSGSVWNLCFSTGQRFATQIVATGVFWSTSMNSSSIAAYTRSWVLTKLFHWDGAREATTSFALGEMWVLHEFLMFKVDTIGFGNSFSLHVAF